MNTADKIMLGVTIAVFVLIAIAVIKMEYEFIVSKQEALDRYIDRVNNSCLYTEMKTNKLEDDYREFKHRYLMREVRTLCEEEFEDCKIIEICDEDERLLGCNIIVLDKQTPDKFIKRVSAICKWEIFNDEWGGYVVVVRF